MPGLLQRCEVSGSSSREDSASRDQNKGESEEEEQIQKKPSANMKRPATNKGKAKEDDSELAALGSCKGNQDDEDDEEGCGESEERKKKKKKKDTKSKTSKKTKKDSVKKDRKKSKHGKKRADKSCGSDEPTSTESVSSESGKVSQDEHQDDVTADMLATALQRAHEAEQHASDVMEAQSCSRCPG